MATITFSILKMIIKDCCIVPKDRKRLNKKRIGAYYVHIFQIFKSLLLASLPLCSQRPIDGPNVLLCTSHVLFPTDLPDNVLLTIYRWPIHAFQDDRQRERESKQSSQSYSYVNSNIMYYLPHLDRGHQQFTFMFPLCFWY